MYKQFFTGITCCLFLISEPVWCSNFPNSNPTFGVRATQKGLWSVLNNPAGLSAIEKFSAGIFYESPFLLEELSTTGFSFALPINKTGIVGLGYKQFGYHLYKEQYLSLTFARPLGNAVSAGVRFDYLSTKFGEDYGKAGVITGSAGVMVKVSEPVRVGVTVFNPSRVRMSRDSKLRHPVEMKAGIAWTFGRHAEIAAGMELASDKDQVICFDFIYNISGKFSLVCGVSGGSSDFYFGYNFKVARFHMGMISGYNELLGFSPQFTLTFNRE